MKTIPLLLRSERIRLAARACTAELNRLADDIKQFIELSRRFVAGRADEPHEQLLWTPRRKLELRPSPREQQLREHQLREHQ